MAQAWQVLYTRGQYEAAVKTAFKLGIFEGRDEIDKATPAEYAKVRLKRFPTGLQKSKGADQRITVQVYRVFTQNRGARWVDVIKTTSEDCAVAFLEDLAACLNRHTKREEVAEMKEKGLT